MPNAPTTTDNLICAECGYDLRSLASDSNCPECGRAIIDSLNAGPLMRWIPRFRRGVTFLAIALFLLNYIHQWVYEQRTNGTLAGRINADAIIVLIQVLLLLPAAWWMSGPADFLKRKPLRPRRWLIVLIVAQFLLAAIEQWMFNSYWPFPYFFGSVLLLSAYALAPLFFALELWLLLELLVGSLKLLPNPLPRLFVRAVLWTFVYALLGPAIISAVVNFNRINYIVTEIEPGGSYLPKPVRAPMLALLSTPAIYLRYPITLSCLVVVLHSRFRMRKGVGLSSQKPSPE